MQKYTNEMYVLLDLPQSLVPPLAQTDSIRLGVYVLHRCKKGEKVVLFYQKSTVLFSKE